jgi:AraC-like DNA-binding protein
MQSQWRTVEQKPEPSAQERVPGRRPVASEATVSLRWIRPFIRITGANPQNISFFEREGVGLKEFADPDARISHRAAMELLTQTVEESGNVRLGIQAGEALEPGDLDVLEYASRSCATVRESILCLRRYMGLMHRAQEVVLREEGDRAYWEVRQLDDVKRPPANNDFTLVSACVFSRRHTGRRGALREVHFQHEVPSDLAEYARIFDEAQLRFGMPHNALVLDRAFLDVPMIDANPGLRAAYELHATELLARLERHAGVSGRVRALLIEHLRSGDVAMSQIARKLAMSASTLRRRLMEEGTTHSDLLDDVRRELAEKYLRDPRLAIGEVAFLLGYSHVTAFYNAFRRWYGMTPAEFRTRGPAR